MRELDCHHCCLDQLPYQIKQHIHQSKYQAQCIDSIYDAEVTTACQICYSCQIDSFVQVKETILHALLVLSLAAPSSLTISDIWWFLTVVNTFPIMLLLFQHKQLTGPTFIALKANVCYMFGFPDNSQSDDGIMFIVKITQK